MLIPNDLVHQNHYYFLDSCYLKKIFIFIHITISRAQSRASQFSEAKTTPAGAESWRVSVGNSTIISYGKSFFEEGSGLCISMFPTPV